MIQRPDLLQSKVTIQNENYTKSSRLFKIYSVVK